MCPLCLASLAITAATCTAVGAAAVAVAARVSRSLAQHPKSDVGTACPSPATPDPRGNQ
jgi:hypothetical protein